MIEMKFYQAIGKEEVMYILDLEQSKTIILYKIHTLNKGKCIKDIETVH